MAPYAGNGLGGDVCTTPECIRLASDVLSSLASNYTELDPCTDFDQLVCGNWESEHPIPPGLTAFDPLTLTRERTENSLKQILESPYPSADERGWITVNLTQDEVKADKENLAQLQEAYQTCMNTTALEDQGLKPLRSFVKRITDAFPAKRAPKRDGKGHDYSSALGKTIALFERFGFESFSKLTIKQQLGDPDANTINFALPNGLDRPVPAEDDLKEYLALAGSLISAVHPSNLTVKVATARMAAAHKLYATILGLGGLAAVESPEPATLTLDEVHKLAPQFNFPSVVDQLAPQGSTDKKALVVNSPVYFKNVSELISETPAEVIQTFFIWKAVSGLSPYVESEKTNAYNRFRQKEKTGDANDALPRWKMCVGLLDAGAGWVSSDRNSFMLDVGPVGLTWSLSRFFLDRFYSKEAQDQVFEMIKNLKAAFKERIATRKWASDEVKKASADKVDKMMEKVAIPAEPKVLQPVEMKKYYESVDITPSLVGTVLSLAKENLAKRWATLPEPYNRHRFRFSTLLANAQHELYLNGIMMALGVQQFPLYDAGFPSYVNYGGLGSVVGHEITHGFDNLGRHFDATGNITEWWDEASVASFGRESACFVEQYGKFAVTAPNGTAVHVNGNQTLGENIADAGGVVTSFEAWRKASEHDKAKSLPGLEHFTHEQLFFVKWGQSWCRNRPAKAALEQVEKDSHSPGGARSQYTLDNSEEFKKVFNCPDKKPVCELW